MSQPGTMRWNLKAKKILSYDVGVGASKPMRRAGAFKMYWHVQGMKTEYEGEIEFNNQKFVVTPSESYGYQDKNWGTDYTNPWIWLNCNRFTLQGSKDVLAKTSLVVGGGTPVLAGVPLERKILVAFVYEERLYEFHFLKLWESPQHRFSCYPNEKGEMVWEVDAENSDARIAIRFSCPLSKMLKINYENPKGQWLHRDLWNGGHAHGTVELFSKDLFSENRIAIFEGSFGGCEFGLY
jgi:hypothetical protein